MFTTGYKEAIINATGIEVSGTDLLIEGVGRYSLVAANMPRFAHIAARVAVNGVFDYTPSTISGVTAGDVLTVALNFGSTRVGAEFTEPRLWNGKPLVLSVIASGISATTLALDIRTALAAMNAEQLASYHIASVTGATTHVIFTMADEFTSATKVELAGPGGIAIGTTSVSITTAPVIGRGLPKQLEEQARAASKGNTDPYGVRSDMQINWNTKYDQITFEVIVNDDTFGNTAVINGGNAGVAKFVLYVAEENSFISAWDATNKALIAAANGTAFGTNEAAWVIAGGLLDI